MTGHNDLLDALLGNPPRPVKPRVFVSYHHRNEQASYDQFASVFSDEFDIFTDTSLERRIDSNDSEYLRRAVREKHISGSSVTIVLCGAETWKRRWVDWEIQMTLNKEHALLGIIVPGCLRRLGSSWRVADRLADNVRSGYAGLVTWPESTADLRAAIDDARWRARSTGNIDNSRPAMKRSRS